MGTLVEGVPEELRGLQRWVCASEGSKRPMSPFGDYAASVDKPATWGAFDQAAARVEAGDYPWLGFVLDGDGFVVVDVDKGAPAFDGDGMLAPDVLEAVEACGSYAEISKSGLGVHIVCKGNLPFKGRCNRRGWEIYKEARHIVLTGRRIYGSRIVECQEAIDAILEKHFATAEDTPGRPHGAFSGRIWEGAYPAPSGGRIAVEEAYEPVSEGGRHLALLSYCGKVWRAGCPERMIGALAAKRNRESLLPPLPDDEAASIARSVTRYGR